MDRLITCRKCGKKYPPNKMRYLNSAKNLLCIDCVDKIRSPPKDVPKKTAGEERRKLRFKCNKCKHIVRIKEGFPKQCSFCGGTNLIEQDWNSDLDNLIEDAGKKIYDN
ncbi:hypothetical protein H6503_02280 [Candidatus Woesearchaeota archaeon]|nr:hypothetical protein [Candidatus Woesearchaeota archaeon]